MTATLRMLLYSDGSDVGTRAIALGKRIAKSMAEAVDILALGNTPDREKTSRREIEDTARELRACGIQVAIYQRPGATRQRVVQQANAVDYDLIVVGSRGHRGLKRLLAGSRACTILTGTTTSVLVVKGSEPHEIKRVLVCSAAGPTSEETVRFAAQLAQAFGASATLLHVMSQVALEEKAEAADLEAEAEELMESQAREGTHLQRMLEIFRSEGVGAQAVVRHGLVVEEIRAEAEDEEFDMLVVGAHITPSIDRLLSSDLSEQIMLAATRPILVVQQE